MAAVASPSALSSSLFSRSGRAIHPPARLGQAAHSGRGRSSSPAAVVAAAAVVPPPPAMNPFASVSGQGSAPVPPPSSVPLFPSFTDGRVSEPVLLNRIESSLVSITDQLMHMQARLSHIEQAAGPGDNQERRRGARGNFDAHSRAGSPERRGVLGSVPSPARPQVSESNNETDAFSDSLYARMADVAAATHRGQSIAGNNNGVVASLHRMVGEMSGNMNQVGDTLAKQHAHEMKENDQQQRMKEREWMDKQLLDAGLAAASSSSLPVGFPSAVQPRVVSSSPAGCVPSTFLSPSFGEQPSLATALLAMAGQSTSRAHNNKIFKNMEEWRRQLENQINANFNAGRHDWTHRYALFGIFIERLHGSRGWFFVSEFLPAFFRWLVDAGQDFVSVDFMQAFSSVQLIMQLSNNSSERTKTVNRSNTTKYESNKPKGNFKCEHHGEHANHTTADCNYLKTHKANKQ